MPQLCKMGWLMDTDAFESPRTISGALVETPHLDLLITQMRYATAVALSGPLSRRGVARPKTLSPRGRSQFSINQSSAFVGSSVAAEHIVYHPTGPAGQRTGELATSGPSSSDDPSPEIPWASALGARSGLSKPPPPREQGNDPDQADKEPLRCLMVDFLRRLWLLAPRCALITAF